MNRTPLPDLDVVSTAAAVVTLAPDAMGSPVAESPRLPPTQEAQVIIGAVEEHCDGSRPVEIVAWVATCWALTCEVLPIE